jgi:hypothetical protein
MTIGHFTWRVSGTFAGVFSGAFSGGNLWVERLFLDHALGKRLEPKATTPSLWR